MLDTGDDVLKKQQENAHYRAYRSNSNSVRFRNFDNKYNNSSEKNAFKILWILAIFKVNKEGISKPVENMHMKNHLPVIVFPYEINAKFSQT